LNLLTHIKNGHSNNDPNPNVPAMDLGAPSYDEEVAEERR